jgi:hypothetical protein
MRLGRALRTGVFLILLAPSLPVWGSTGGVTNVGGFSTSAEHFTGLREWVELDSTGKLLKGFLDHDLLKLMTVYAPGEGSGHMIFRELATLDGRRSFLLTAPQDLVEKIQRITLFLQPKSHSLELYEQNEGVWIKRMPQPLRVADPHDDEDTPQDLLAFSLEKPGFFWILESPSLPLSRSSFVPQDSSAKSLMGGSILWGFSAWAASILLLSISWFISRWLHTFDQISRS